MSSQFINDRARIQIRGCLNLVLDNFLEQMNIARFCFVLLSLTLLKSKSWGARADISGSIIFPQSSLPFLDCQLPVCSPSLYYQATSLSLWQRAALGS